MAHFKIELLCCALLKKEEWKNDINNKKYSKQVTPNNVFIWGKKIISTKKNSSNELSDSSFSLMRKLRFRYIIQIIKTLIYLFLNVQERGVIWCQVHITLISFYLVKTPSKNVKKAPKFFFIEIRISILVDF